MKPFRSHRENARVNAVYMRISPLNTISRDEPEDARGGARRALRVAHGAAVGGPRWKIRRVHGARMARTALLVPPRRRGAPRPDPLRARPLRVLDRGGGGDGILGR